MSQLNFKKFLAEKAQADNLPFDIDFEFIAVESENFVTIADKRISVLNDLTVAESWFLELMQNQLNLIRRDFKIAVNQLTNSLAMLMPTETKDDLLNYLMFGLPDYVEDENGTDESRAFDLAEYNVKLAQLEEFQTTWADAITKVGEMYKLINRNFTSDMMMVTFFLMTRHDVNWTLAKTATMPLAVIDEIKALIFKEARKGADLEPDEDADEDEGAVEGK
jgi:transcription initiation factor IIF auxiliary subunit